MNYRAMIEVRYSELAAGAGPVGVKRSDAVRVIAADLAAAVGAGEVEVPVDYELLVDDELDRLDVADRNQQEHRLLIARDSLAGENILGTLDPVLEAVCAIGGGVRKTYRNLTVSDLLAIVRRKQKHATDAAVAAGRVTDVVTDLVDAMQSQAATYLGDLWP